MNMYECSRGTAKGIEGTVHICFFACSKVRAREPDPRTQPRPDH